MADELTREEAIERLGAIYSSALEGKDLEKRLATIPKTLDKYEGKWQGLITAAEKKYGKPEADESEATEEEESQAGGESEKPAKKRGGFFSRRSKPEEEPEEPQAEEPQEEEDPQAEEAEEPQEEEEDSQAEEAEEPQEGEEDPQAEEAEEPAKKRGGFFSRRSKPEEEPEEPQAEETIDEPAEAPEDEPNAGGHEDLADSEEALEAWKGRISSDGGNPEVWRGLASYFASAGRPGRARACEERADELS